jgi:hypothetical protein
MTGILLVTGENVSLLMVTTGRSFVTHKEIILRQAQQLVPVNPKTCSFRASILLQENIIVCRQGDMHVYMYKYIDVCTYM